MQRAREHKLSSANSVRNRTLEKNTIAMYKNVLDWQYRVEWQKGSYEFQEKKKVEYKYTSLVKTLKSVPVPINSESTLFSQSKRDYKCKSNRLLSLPRVTAPGQWSGVYTVRERICAMDGSLPKYTSPSLKVK